MPFAIPQLPAPHTDDKAAAFERLPQFQPHTGHLAEDARDFLRNGREVILALHRGGTSGRTTVRATSELIDRLLQGLFEALSRELAPLPPMSLVALGGYGRKELAPRSDLDLLLLHDAQGGAPAAVASFAEKLLYLLWDLKLEVGWGLRTADECAQLASQDHTARTALVDCRPLAGSQHLYEGLESAVLKDLLTRFADQFIRDKVDELRRRRLKYGDTVFLLEPNLKQGEGGLRDLQAGLWIARARFRAAGVSDLLHRSILPPGEVAGLLAARDLLWRVRNEMHYATGRKEDRLTFDLQVQVAKSLGYEDGPEGLGVERFLRHYYLAASAIKRATDALIDRCEEPRRRARVPERKLDHEFKIWGDRLTLCSNDLLERDPTAMVRLFAAADREGMPLYSWARDRVAHEVGRIDDRVRASPQVAATLRQMFVRPGTRGDFLLAMHELGVLGALLPEFGRVTAKAQHDLYHVYTVDVHSIFAVRKLYALRAGELAEKEPTLTTLMQSLSRPLPLYLGTLMHDAGKGGGSGHAERGAQLMRQVAQRLALSAEDARDAEFLVAKHLYMSHVSQRRDLSDPHLIEGFAAEVGDADRLLMLYLLTWADMSSVAPNTWNDWKARLLQELYEKAKAALEGKRREEGSREALERLRSELLRHAAPDETERFLKVVPERYLRTATGREAARHLRLLRRGSNAALSAALFHRQDHTELTLTAADRPGLLALFAGALAAHHIDIMRAQIFSTSDGRALDVFAVRGRPGGPVERERWRAARADLKAALEGRLDVESLLRKRTSSTLQERFVPKVAVHVAVDNHSAEDATVLDVYAPDRTGLLHDIARTLFEHGVEINLAKIATEGNRAADGFYVRKDGRKIEDPALLAKVEKALREKLA